MYDNNIVYYLLPSSSPSRLPRRDWWMKQNRWDFSIFLCPFDQSKLYDSFVWLQYTKKAAKPTAANSDLTVPSCDILVHELNRWKNNIQPIIPNSIQYQSTRASHPINIQSHPLVGSPFTIFWWNQFFLVLFSVVWSGIALHIVSILWGISCHYIAVDLACFHPFRDNVLIPNVSLAFVRRKLQELFASFPRLLLQIKWRRLRKRTECVFFILLSFRSKWHVYNHTNCIECSSE